MKNFFLIALLAATSSSRSDVVTQFIRLSVSNNGACISTKSVVYKATVKENSNNNTAETYTGLTKSTFKQRYNGHKTSFRNKKHEHETTLSSHIWKLQDAGADYSIELSIIDNGRKFDPNTRKCMLCLKEKYHILFNPAGASLNQKSELFSVCRHRLEKLLVNT